MSRKDFFHDAFRRSLEADGWRVTHDPLILPFLNSMLKVDIGAERLEMTKGLVKIAVELKNFKERKDYANEFHKALGQTISYKARLKIKEPDRDTYLAITVDAYNEVYKDPVNRQITLDSGIKLIIFDPVTETIVKWNP